MSTSSRSCAPWARTSGGSPSDVGREAFCLDAFKTLGLNSTADLEAVKAAYHALVKQWHPDQFSDEGMQQKAQQKLIELNLAYEEALKAVQGRPAAIRDIPLPEAKTFARHLYESGHPASALRQLARTSEKDAEYYHLEGQILTALRQYGSAHQAFRAAVQMEPTNREYHRAAFQAAKNYQKHRKWPYRFADWANGLFHPRDREKM